MKKNPEKILNSQKAYDNFDFIHSGDGRIIRLIAEYLYPEQYLRKKNVRGAIVFYGSARTLSLEQYNHKLEKLEEDLKNSSANDIVKIQNELTKLKNSYDLTLYYEDGVQLAKKFAEWLSTKSPFNGLYIASGGGGGMMEAANKGAFLANQDNIGLNISLPFEQKPNIFISPDLNFEFHYFFMRKFWFVYLAKAIITMPGGFGTLDELMEILTLKQTLKVTKPLPIVLYGSKFWKELINFDLLIQKGLICEKDMELFKFADTPDEAFDYVTSQLEKSIKKKEKALTLK